MFSLLFVSFGLLCSGVIVDIHGMPPASYESDWLLIESQSSTNSYLEVAHNLLEVPLKVKVFVRPETGPYADWLFEAGTSQQASDRIPWLYCGILYSYNATHVQLSAPTSSGRQDTGRAFCIDPWSWTSGSSLADVSQVEQRVLVKVKAWTESVLPAPDLDTGWLSIYPSVHFIEISHSVGSELSLALLHVRCTPENITDSIYAEATGVGNDPCMAGMDNTSFSGIVFAYSDSSIRIWNFFNGDAYSVGFQDGYGSGGYRCTDGEIRVRGWRSSEDWPEQFSLTLTDLNQIPDMSSLRPNIKHWDPLNDYISVQVKALDGLHAGFVFPAIGQGYRNDYPETKYGGVMFGYTADKIRIFVPANDNGSMIHVTGSWGAEPVAQVSNNVEIIVKIWSDPKPSCSGSRAKMGSFFRLQEVNCAGYVWSRCVVSCLIQPDCVGIIPCSPAGPCQLMNLDDLNKRIAGGILGMEGEVVIRLSSCE